MKNNVLWTLIHGLAWLLLLPLIQADACGDSTRRGMARPLANHPGNIFLAGEPVAIAIPDQSEAAWVLTDYEGRELSRLVAAGGKLVLGTLPVGYYELNPTPSSATNRVSLGVLAPLMSPTPRSSPIGLDVAMAWFYPTHQMTSAASLCALAGINWVRDRLLWTEMESRPGVFSGANKYDAAAEAQFAAGLRVLQVIHLSPAWANPEVKRFPLDLRDAYRFYQAMAKRWRGKVEAFEPWNEADIEMFGGHTGSEIATLQKAAHWGLKSGNPDIVDCQNVFALHSPAILTDFVNNEPAPYFSTFNLHHYVALAEFPQVYAEFRAVSGGRPLWTTECSIPVPWTGDSQQKEPAPADLRLQAERVAPVMATALHEGTSAVFYFLLPHYAEGKIQFGILRPDLTPRPAFLALAAVGRLLADAKPLGRLTGTDAAISGYLFRAAPDGHTKEVLVVWTTGKVSSLVLPVKPEAVYDLLGRALGVTNGTANIDGSPRFVVFPKGTRRRMNLATPPLPVPSNSESPSPVVLQAVWPTGRIKLAESAYQIDPTKEETIPLYVYNFGTQVAKGTLDVQTPETWQVNVPASVTIHPGQRLELSMKVRAMKSASAKAESIWLRGQFGKNGSPVLSLRLLAAP